VARSLENLAAVYEAKGLNKEAEPYFLRALALLEKKQGPDHPDIIKILNRLVVFYKKMKKPEKVSEYLDRAEAMQERLSGRK
jgi:tetratricopeptide (TPR) repeat protein